MMNASKNTYVIDVSLRAGRYRHIRISGAAKLSDLHAAILEVFGFKDDHAHAFFMDNRVWSKQDSFFTDLLEDQYGDEERYTGYYSLDDLDLTIGSQFKYVFDFGDERVFQCKVSKILDEPAKGRLKDGLAEVK
jgi:hypothetical protein